MKKDLSKSTVINSRFKNCKAIKKGSGSYAFAKGTVINSTFENCNQKAKFPF